MERRHRVRIVVTFFVLLVGAMYAYIETNPTLDIFETQPSTASKSYQEEVKLLSMIEVKGRAPKTGYERTQFGDGWLRTDGCDTRNQILARDLKNIRTNEKCQVISGTLNDPYTAKEIVFSRGESTSDDVQIDHVVALSNAWQTGAQQLTAAERISLANDPLELIAVDGAANQQKSDGDAATWLPSNKSFRCDYVARQVRVKAKYRLWVTPPEKAAIENVLSRC